MSNICHYFLYRRRYYLDGTCRSVYKDESYVIDEKTLEDTYFLVYLQNLLVHKHKQTYFLSLIHSNKLQAQIQLFFQVEVTKIKHVKYEVTAQARGETYEPFNAAHDKIADIHGAHIYLDRCKLYLQNLLSW